MIAIVLNSLRVPFFPNKVKKIYFFSIILLKFIVFENVYAHGILGNKNQKLIFFCPLSFKNACINSFFVVVKMERLGENQRFLKITMLEA